jgi:hypothetical protein
MSVSPGLLPRGRAKIALVGLALTMAASLLVATPGPVTATSAGATPESPAGWLNAIETGFGHVVRLAADVASDPTFTDPAPPVQTIRLKPRPKPGPFAMDLYGKGDFVHQQTAYWCVAASVQTMMNIIDDGAPRRSKRRQARLHFEARDLDRSGDAYWRKLAGPSRWRQGLHGLGLTDWADLLTTNGYGPYEVERAPTMKKAVRMAAKAIRTTGRPAGLVVWRGAHAWVMSGFTATADPAYTNRFSVREVFIQDPWYPDVSSIWGASLPPDSAITVAALRGDFLRYNRPGRRQPMRDGKFMMILPTLPPDTQLR